MYNTTVIKIRQQFFLKNLKKFYFIFIEIKLSFTNQYFSKEKNLKIF